jgi:hypothetical protein
VLVGPVAEAVDQADRDRDHASGLQVRRQAAHLGSVRRLQHLTVGENPFVDLEGQLAWDQGVRELDLRVVHVVAMLVADREHVAEALGDDQRGG